MRQPQYPLPITNMMNMNTKDLFGLIIAYLIKHIMQNALKNLTQQITDPHFAALCTVANTRLDENYCRYIQHPHTLCPMRARAYLENAIQRMRSQHQARSRVKSHTNGKKASLHHNISILISPPEVIPMM